MKDVWVKTVKRSKDAEQAVTPVGNFGGKDIVKVDNADSIASLEPKAKAEDNKLYPVYYCVLDEDNTTVIQRGVVQKVEFDKLKSDGVNIRKTNGHGNIIDA